MARALLFAVIMLGAGTLLLLWFLVRLVRKMTHDTKKGEHGRRLGGVSYGSIFAALILISLSWLFFWSVNLLKSFRPCESPAVICYIEVKPGPDNVKSIELDYYTDTEGYQTSAANFYLSGDAWKVKGQYIRFTGIMKAIFGVSEYYKVTDVYSDYRGHKPPGIDAAILTHQSLDGGAVDLDGFSSLMETIHGPVEIGKFETDYQRLYISDRNWLVSSIDGAIEVKTKPPKFVYIEQ
jgi:hypothetical protein